MEDIYHPVLNNNSIFKIYQSKNESFLYGVLAAIYTKTIDRRLFNLPNAYIKYKKKLNLENISFPMKNKNIKVFLQNNPKLNLRIRLFDSIIVSNKEMRIYETKDMKNEYNSKSSCRGKLIFKLYIRVKTVN